MRVDAPGLAGWCAVLLIATAGVAAAADQRLAQAVRSGRQEMVRTLLQQRVDVNAPQPDGTTALHWAAHGDRVDTAALLIGAGAKVDAVNDFGVTPLSLACTNASAAMVDLLLRAGADPNVALPTGETPLMTAARTGNPKAVASLLERQAPVDVRENLKGQTALMWAAAEGHADVVKLLVEHGADVNAKSKAGFTPLLLAARDADIDTSRLLIGAGAKVNQTATDGTSPLTVAVIRGHTRYAQYLLDQGAYVDAGPGFTPLHWAVGDWSVELAGDNTFVRPEGSEWDTVLGLRGPAKIEMVELLLAYGADVNAQAQSSPRYSGGRGRGGKQAGANAFLMAAQNADVEMMRVLLSYGADPLVRTSNGVSAMMFAAGLASDFSIGYTSIKEKDALEAVKLCYALGDTEVTHAEKYGDTALHGALYRGLTGSNSLIEFLIANGADPNVKNKRGWSPVTIAEGVYTNNSNTRSPEALALLMKRGGVASPPNVERDAYSVIDDGTNQGTIGTQAIPQAVKPPATTTPKP
jgi:ankyrin repeat protein